MLRKIQQYDIEISYDHSQYFTLNLWRQSYMDFDDLATGIGQSERDAAEDACEQITHQGYDTSTIDTSAYSGNYTQLCECSEDDDCDHHYFVTIRVK